MINYNRFVCFIFLKIALLLLSFAHSQLNGPKYPAWLKSRCGTSAWVNSGCKSSVT